MKFIAPIHIIDYTGAPGGVQAGFKKFYLKDGYFKLYDGATISDVVLGRPLDNYTPTSGTITANDTVLTALEKLAYAISNVSSNQSLQDTVNIGNGISNFVTGSNADIQSTNFVSNRILYLNNNAFATIKIVDNLDDAHNLTIDLDTININGVPYNWSDIVSPPPSILSALPFSTDHLTATNNQYVIGDVVWYLGDVYRCIANNDSIIPTATAYWVNIGAGYPIVQQPIDWTSTTGNNQILNKPTIPSITGLVPYTGATQNVDLGLFEITAAKLIKDGGQPQQFLKADGSVDNNVYLTSADLPSTLDLFATTSPDPVISGYTALVRTITDTRYNTIAVDVPTPTITGTVLAPTFCGAVISDPSILLGNPGVFNFSVIGKIRRTGGSASSGADFFYRIYKRNLAGTETLIAESAPVVVPANGGVYTEYISIALWNDGIFLNTDRVVLKFYGIKTGGGSGATYEFLFGGSDPVRGTAAISSAIIPNIYLKDLADVEKVPALDNEVLYWNDADSLWEHSLVEDLVPDATAIVRGLLSSTDWVTFNNKQNALIRRHSFEGTYDYNAYALQGSLESENVWTITRILVSGNGSTSVAHATNVAWTDRLSVTYTT